jgi:hypothetical protein
MPTNHLIVTCYYLLYQPWTRYVVNLALEIKQSYSSLHMWHYYCRSHTENVSPCSPLPKFSFFLQSVLSYPTMNLCLLFPFATDSAVPCIAHPSPDSATSPSSKAQPTLLRGRMCKSSVSHSWGMKEWIQLVPMLRQPSLMCRSRSRFYNGSHTT